LNGSARGSLAEQIMWKKILGGIAILLAVAALGLVAWYQLVYIPPRYSPADPKALTALTSDRQVTVDTRRWISFSPSRSVSDTGFIFYPGGQCATEGYAEPLRAVAAAGFLVVAVPMPLDLAVLAPDRADAVMAAHPEIKRWVIGGHSLGGAMAAQYVFQHPGRMAGLLLWDAYADPAYDLATATLPVRQIHRVSVEGKDPEKYVQTRHLQPAATEIIRLPGASHLQFGRFVPAERFRQMGGDVLNASMPIAEQHARVAAASVEFLQRIADGG
jgi:Alpha/beta hydrolase family